MASQDSQSVKDENVVWHPHAVTRADREKQHGHLGAVLWFTGLSGSGKSTVAGALEQALHAAQVKPRIAMEIGSREALREAVVRGLGLGVVSEAEFIADPNIRVIRIEGAALYTETYLYCLAERRSSRLISSFFDAALA